MRAVVLLLLPLLLGLCSAHTLAIANTDSPTPIQQRIALQPGGMTVSWSTTGPIGVTPTVVYGTSPTSLTSTSSGYTLHYSPSITYFHHVVLNGLTASTLYYWKVTSPSGVSSPTLSFTSAPTAGTNRPFTVAVYGDMGLVDEDYTVATLSQWVTQGKVDFFLHVGDLSYADDWVVDDQYESVTEQWMNKQQGIWTEKPYMILPGNHEASCSEVWTFLCPDGERNFTSYLQRFRMPAVESGAVNNMYYSFDYGLVHFVNIDTEVDFPNSPEGPGTRLNAGPFGDQLMWLANDLKKAVANRAQVPWIIVSGHRPYYTSAGGTASVQAAFEPLLLQYGVDVVFQGHVHRYERLYPTGAGGVVQQKSYAEATAPIYLVSASAGNVEGFSKGGITQPYTAFIDDAHYGIGLLSVYNATQLSWTFINSQTQAVIDSIDIIKSKRWATLQQH